MMNIRLPDVPDRDDVGSARFETALDWADDEQERW
jgi:hypothetical protein